MTRFTPIGFTIVSLFIARAAGAVPEKGISLITGDRLLVSASTPVAVRVTAPTDVSEKLLGRIFAEAEAIWEPTGVTFDWRRASAKSAIASQLDVTIENPRENAATWQAPLGWIVFAAGTPDRSIHLSQASAEALIRRTVTAVDTTLGAHEILVGRALGRAFAHEFGHYLLQSKTHTIRGLMRPSWQSEEFLSVGRRGFELTPDERDAAVRHLRVEEPTDGQR